VEQVIGIQDGDVFAGGLMDTLIDCRMSTLMLLGKNPDTSIPTVTFP
jgi:hypothetical protein